MDSLFVKNSVSIKASPAKVWNTLVNPEETKKYMFGCETVSDWKVGSELLWKGEYEGQEMVFVKGTIVAIEPEKLLIYTTIDPNNPATEDKPENYLKVSYELVQDGDETILTASQGDYSKVGDGANRYKETVDGGGWQPILDQIKTLVESD